MGSWIVFSERGRDGRQYDGMQVPVEGNVRSCAGR